MLRLGSHETSTSCENKGCRQVVAKPTRNTAMGTGTYFSLVVKALFDDAAINRKDV